MRCTTLQATGDKVGRLLDYYAGLADDREHPGRRSRGPVDYYLDPDEPAGRWWGSGTEALGISGDVEGGDMRAVLDGLHPVTGRKLGRGFGSKSARGFDATFSAPKSVSVLWALTPDAWVRAEVLAAHDAAVEAALAWFERHGAVTRRGTNGVDQVDTLGVTVAVFRQHTSRTVDPQLHSHAVIAAKVQDPAGGWLSLDAGFLKRQQCTMGWIYDAALRAELTGRLGVEWRSVDGRPTDLECVPQEVCDELSARTVQVAAKLTDLVQRWQAENDGVDPDHRTIAMLQRRAVVTSRPAKTHGVQAVTLHDQWVGQAHGIGFDLWSLTADRLAAAKPLERPREAGLILEALRRVSDESSVWLRADVARHLATLVPIHATRTAAETVEFIDRLAERAERLCVELGPTIGGQVRRDGRPVREAVTDRLFTTSVVLTQEIELQRWAEANAAPPPVGVTAQRAAFGAITGSDRLVVIVGPAGTGKTATTAHAIAHLTAHCRPVVGLAPSGRAADVLGAEARCPTDTVAGFLARHRDRTSEWPAGTTVILDEAAMTATADLADLVKLAQRHKWRLVAIGDPAQLPAVGRGGMFAHWCDTVPHTELTTPRRFHQPWEADASLQLRAGDPKAAETYDLHGRLRTAHPATVAFDVARTHRRCVDDGRIVAITTSSAATARAINTAIQHTQAPRRGPGAAFADGTTARVGDQIATRRNDPTLRTDSGVKVRNRHTWHVTDVAADGTLTVTHAERGTVQLPARYVAEHVELGWAVTGYGNQGDTVDVGIAVLEPGATRNHTYVAMTRGRDTNIAVITELTGSIDPAVAFVDIIGRAPNRHAALATTTRLHQDADLAPPALDELTVAATNRARRLREQQHSAQAWTRSPSMGRGR